MQRLTLLFASWEPARANLGRLQNGTRPMPMAASLQEERLRQRLRAATPYVLISMACCLTSSVFWSPVVSHELVWEGITMEFETGSAWQKVERAIVLVGLLAILGTETLWAAKWTSLGPDGGSVFVLAVDPQNTST